MRIDKVYLEDFKNLKKFTIDLDEREMKTVLLGQNATGKSNFIEALILIFKYLDLQKDPPKELIFRYKIEYQIGKNKVIVDYLDGKYSFNVLNKIKLGKKESWVQVGKQISKTEFFNRKEEFLPKYVFTYYSGLSNKLKELFWEHQRNFYDKIIKPDFVESELESLRKLFYVQLIHSYFVLLAYFSFEEEEKKSLKFLNEVLQIEDLESILFVIKQPAWKGKGDPRFFGADGLVKEFLSYLWDLSIAPIYDKIRVKEDFRTDGKNQERLYLFIKDKRCLKKLAGFYKDNTNFFKALESTYISDLIAEVRVKVSKKHAGKIVFKELSEGEQQLLTVLGLLKFTKDDDSLILLDEPDTHLNPIWKWRYLEFLEEVVERPESTQIIINTHDPLVIGSLRKEEVRVFRSEEGKVETEQPDIDPRGLGVEGILTSELFGLPTVVDEFTLSKLNRRNELLIKQQENKLTESDKTELNNLFTELEALGFSKTFRDPLYQKFITAFKSRYQSEHKEKYTKEEIEAQNKLALEILNEIEKEEVK